jgi:UDP-N-acetylglucosamine--N-acetylmuramyl-(pentapeptide) pyrophosphoryl-undecaprenol N-acetylglucosamine transferase
MAADPAGPALFIATTGGHLDELHQLQTRLRPAPQAVEWVTHAGGQLHSLLRGETVHVVPYIGPRDYRSLAANMMPALKILRARRYSMIVTTGAGIALPFAALSRLRGLPFHYIESAARADGPSFTGAMAARISGINLYTQYPNWADARWQYRGSLFDGFDASSAAPPNGVDRVVVTLGTMRTFGFRRAVEALVRVLPAVVNSGAEILWQTGCTDITGLRLRTHETVPTAELRAAIAGADLVVAHAGVGSALTALETGHRPLLLPREAAHHEHVDNHQSMIAAELSQRGLAVSSCPDTLSVDHVLNALAGHAGKVTRPPVFSLQ